MEKMRENVVGRERNFLAMVSDWNRMNCNMFALNSYMQMGYEAQENSKEENGIYRLVRSMLSMFMYSK